jgi:D-tyrosyl-tRNA(Tyr) deacylase
MLIGIEQDVVGYGGHHYAYAPSRTMLEEDVVARVELLLKTI